MLSTTLRGERSHQNAHQKSSKVSVVAVLTHHFISHSCRTASRPSHAVQVNRAMSGSHR